MNLNDIKSRKDFYERNIDLDRVNQIMPWLLSKCSFKEISFIFRTMVYDQVSWWDQNNKGKVYDGTYSSLNIEQANRFQQQISSLVDLFEQSVVDKREFDEGYLKDYEFARVYLRILKEKEDRIAALESAIKSLKDV